MNRQIINHSTHIVFLVAAIVMLWPTGSIALDRVYSSFFGVAIKGYDTVAYHTEGRAVKGTRKYAHKWNGSKWLFVSSDHRDLFITDPERYAPQYGGY